MLGRRRRSLPRQQRACSGTATPKQGRQPDTGHARRTSQGIHWRSLVDLGLTRESSARCGRIFLLTPLAMPTPAYAVLPTLDHVALRWAKRRGIDIGTDGPEGAQRALEILLECMPPSLRPATRDWPLTRRNYCRRTGTADPREHLRGKGYWGRWLATRGLSKGDTIGAEQALSLRRELNETAQRFHGIAHHPSQSIWRRRGWVGVNNTAIALVLTTLRTDEVLLDVVATRSRSALKRRNRDKSRARYQEKTPTERKRLIEAMRRRRQRARTRLGHMAHPPRRSRVLSSITS
jgi:hypothetical protein